MISAKCVCIAHKQFGALNRFDVSLYLFAVEGVIDLSNENKDYEACHLRRNGESYSIRCVTLSPHTENVEKIWLNSS